jgi:hypothetical protein
MKILLLLDPKIKKNRFRSFLKLIGTKYVSVSDSENQSGHDDYDQKMVFEA